MLTHQQARQMTQTFNPDGVAPSRVLAESLAQDWPVPEMQVLDCYTNDSHSLTRHTRTLTKETLLKEWIDLVNSHKWLPYHSYKIFVRYRINHKHQREFEQLIIRDIDSLTAGYGNLVEIFKVTL